MRKVPPSRRPSVVIATGWEGFDITVCAGLDPDTGQPIEVFVDLPKGGQMQDVLDDVCVVISLALQHGIPAAALAKSLSTVPDVQLGGGAEKHGSPIGVIVDVVKSLDQ